MIILQTTHLDSRKALTMAGMGMAKKNQFACRHHTSSLLRQSLNNTTTAFVFSPTY